MAHAHEIPRIVNLSHIPTVRPSSVPVRQSFKHPPPRMKDTSELATGNRDSRRKNNTESTATEPLSLDWDYGRLNTLFTSPQLRPLSLPKPPAPASPNTSRKRVDGAHRRNTSSGVVTTAKEVAMRPPRGSSRNWQSWRAPTERGEGEEKVVIKQAYKQLVPARQRTSPRGTGIRIAQHIQPYQHHQADGSTSSSASSCWTPSSGRSSPEALPSHTLLAVRNPSDYPAVYSARPLPSLLSYAAPICAPSTPNHAAVIFDASLHPRHVTRLLFWYLYYDLIEPPKSAKSWYSKIPETELRGWIALGTAIRACPSVEFPTLRKTCRSSGVCLTDVRYVLYRLASERSMRRTELGEIVQWGRDRGFRPLEVLWGVKEKLEKDRRLLERVLVRGEGCGEEWEYMQWVLLRRVDDYLKYKVCPRLGLEVPDRLLGEKGSEVEADVRVQSEKQVAIGVLKSYSRLMIERNVPLEWYE